MSHCHYQTISRLPQLANAMAERSITVLQWNCRGIYRKLHEFKKFLSDLDIAPDLIALQETHLVERYTPKIHGYRIFRKDKSISSGGLAIFVKENLSVSNIDIDISTTSRIEVQCIQVSYLPTKLPVKRRRSDIFGQSTGENNLSRRFQLSSSDLEYICKPYFKSKRPKII